MKKKLIVCLFYFLLISIFALNANGAETIVINNVDWAPFFFGDNKDKPKGIGREILEICLSKTGFNYTFKTLPIKRTHSYMKEGKIEICVYSYKKTREDFVIYGKEPLFASEYRFLVRADSDIHLKSLKDLESLKFGHLDGLTYTPELLKIINEKHKTKTIDYTYSIDLLIKKLLKKRFDITADSKETFLWKAKELNVLDKVKVLDFNIKTKSYFATVSKQSKKIKNKHKFLNRLDACIRQLKVDGRYTQILLKYGIK